MEVIFPYIYELYFDSFYSWWSYLLKSKNYFCFHISLPSVFPGT